MMPKAWKKILISFKKPRTREGTEIADFKIAAYCANQTDVHETILQGSSIIYLLYLSQKWQCRDFEEDGKIYALLSQF